MKKLVLIPLVLLSLSACASTTSSSAAATVTTSSSAEVVNYTIHKGLVYGSASSKELGDIYEPNALTSNTLGIVLIHGGAFAMGNETMFASTAKWLANHGAVVYCVDYRLLAEKKFPGAVSDIKAAVRYLRKNASAYHVDANKIVCWGESAGAYLGVMATMTGGTTTFDGDVSDALETSSTVNACVDFYGPCCVKQYKDSGLCNFLGITAATVDDSANAALVTSSDPTTYVSNFTSITAPRVVIQHGDADTTVSNNESHYLYDGLSAAYGTSKITLEIKAGLHHMDSGFYTDENLTATLASLASYLA